MRPESASFTVSPRACPGKGGNLSAHLCHVSLPRVVDVSLPRFSITGTYDLKKTLSHLGIIKIFEEHGDLSRIVPHQSLKVGQVSLPGLGAALASKGSLRTAPGQSGCHRSRTSQNSTHQSGQAPTSHVIRSESRTFPGLIFSVLKTGTNLLVLFWKSIQCNKQSTKVGTFIRSRTGLCLTQTLSQRPHCLLGVSHKDGLCGQEMSKQRACSVPEHLPVGGKLG